MIIEKLAIITTHPIQYYAPLFKKLSLKKKFAIRVFYTWSQAKDKVYDPDFGRERSWDIPLLDGYDYTFVKNVAKVPGSHHFRGILNPSLNAEIQAWSADAVLIIGWSFTSHLAAMRFFKGKIPVLFRGDSNLLDEPAGFSFKKMVRRIFLTWVYRHIDYALYVGSANKRYYITHKVPQRKLVFAPHAVDNDRFAGNSKIFESNAAKWKKELEIGEWETVFLYAAKLTPKKQPGLLIEAFLSLQNQAVRLIIVGNGELEKKLKETYNKNPRIIFIDFQNQSEMPVTYRLANVFCLPSKGPGETWGLAVNEAMACGRPVIVSDKAGCAVDLVKEGENGFVFNSASIDDLQNKMKLSISKKNELTAMGEKSSQIIKDWTYEKIVQSIESIIACDKHK